MSKRMDIEELLRSQLGQAEVEPSPGAWSAVLRQLRMKKFLRFDPGSFNAYYLGALIVAGTGLTLMLSSQAAEKEPIQAERIVQDIQDSEPTKNDGFKEDEKKGISLLKKRRDKSAEASDQSGSKNLQQEDKGDISADSISHPGEDSLAIRGEAMEKEREEGLENTKEDSLILPAPEAAFSASSYTGCAPFEVHFDNACLYATEYRWNFGTGDLSQDESPIYTFLHPGRYTITLHASTPDGQRSSYHEVIEVFPRPGAAFEIAEGLPTSDGSISLELMNYSTGAFSYEWNLVEQKGGVLKEWGSNEFQPALSTRDIPSGARYIRLVAGNEHACSDTMLLELPAQIGSSAKKLIFATAFEASHTGPTGGAYSPHEKRKDIFHPQFSEEPAQYQLQIYSRLGELAFETQDLYTGWDGYIQQQSRAAAGVYLWIVKGFWQDGTAIDERGDVTLFWSDRRWP